MWLLIIITALVSVLFLYLRWNGTYWKRRGVVGPKPLPIIGNMWKYIRGKKHYGEVYDEIYRAHPDVPYVGVYKLCNQPAILLRDLDLIKDIMSTSFAHFYNNDFVVNNKIDPLICNNPFAAVGENWKTARMNMAPLFTSMKIKMIFPIINEISERFVTYISKNRENANAAKLCARYTLEVIASCGFGVQAQTLSSDDSVFQKMTENIYSDGSLIKTTAVLFLPALSRIFKIRFIPVAVDNWMRSMVNEIVELRKDSTQHRSDLLQILLDAKEKRGDITDTMLTGYCLSMLLEGFEASSGLMSYCLFELASNQDIQRKAQAEIDRLLEKNGGKMTEPALQEMHYLDGICYETSRLYASMLVLTKICNKRYELPPQYPDTQKENVIVEPGTVMVIPVFSIHHDPNYYTNPDVFDPNRFMGENKNQHHKFAYLSFGEGQRICIGIKFALAQSKIGIAAILANYDVHLAPKQKLPLVVAKTSFLLSSKNGMWLNFVDRKKNI